VLSEAHRPHGGRDVLRSWRLPGFVAVASVLGVFSHLAAGGSTPAVPGLLVSLAALLATWSLLARQEQSSLRLVALVWLSQVEVHLGLTMTWGPAGHHHDAGVSLAMIGAHALAGMVVAWWLRRGEAFAWGAACRLGSMLVARPHVVLVLRPSAGFVEVAGPRAVATRWPDTAPRRGPPGIPCSIAG